MTAVVVAVVLPLLGAVLVALAGRSPNLRDGVTLGTSLATFGVVASIAPDVMSGARPEAEIVSVIAGVGLAFRIEPLGMLFGLVSSSLWIVTSIYAFGYMRGHHEVNQTRFFVCFAVAISAALGIAFSANLFTLFLFYEAMTFSTYPLVTHHGTAAARRAGACIR